MALQMNGHGKMISRMTNDEFKTVWDVVDWLEERCEKIKDKDILERYRQVYFDLISEIANRIRAHENKESDKNEGCM